MVKVSMGLTDKFWHFGATWSPKPSGTSQILILFKFFTLVSCWLISGGTFNFRNWNWIDFKLTRFQIRIFFKVVEAH